MIAMRPLVLCALALFASCAAFAQPASNLVRDPAAILAAAKVASGGGAWDALKTQHSKVTILSGNVIGKAERWSDIPSGRSYLQFALGSITGTLGYDGEVAWSQEPSGQSRIETASAARELANNAAYRDQLAFWFPARHAANIRYKGRATADGADFDVVTITPAGGRDFELWVNIDTKLIERLVEREASVTRTEIYMNWSEVDGVKIPYRVRTTRGDPKFDEVIIVDAMDFNGSLSGISFARPEPPIAAFTFPADKTSVELPFEILNGHIYVRVGLNGKGPFRMLLDSSAINVAMPELVQALGLKMGDPAKSTSAADPPADPSSIRITQLEIGGVTLQSQAFAAIPLTEFMRRVEGLDDVSGVFGYELFRRFPIKIDYQRSRLVIYEPTSWSYSGDGVAIPFEFKDHFPQVRGSVDGIDGAFVIDTGSRSSLTLGEPFARKNGLAAKFGAKQEIISGAGPGGYARALVGRAATLTLGDVTITNPVTYLSTATDGPFSDPDTAGNVGNPILRRFNVTFDYPHQQLYFEKNANYGEPDVHDRSGMWIERGEKGYVLVEVTPLGPAAQAGLKAGDVIVTIDGKAVAAIPLTELRLRLKAAPGTKLRLKLESGPVHVVTLRNLI